MMGTTARRDVADDTTPHVSVSHTTNDGRGVASLPEGIPKKHDHASIVKTLDSV